MLLKTENKPTNSVETCALERRGIAVHLLHTLEIQKENLTETSERIVLFLARSQRVITFLEKILPPFFTSILVQQVKQESMPKKGSFIQRVNRNKTVTKDFFQALRNDYQNIRTLWNKSTRANLSTFLRKIVLDLSSPTPLNIKEISLIYPAIRAMKPIGPFLSSIMMKIENEKFLQFEKDSFSLESDGPELLSNLLKKVAEDPDPHDLKFFIWCLVPLQKLFDENVQHTSSSVVKSLKHGIDKKKIEIIELSFQIMLVLPDQHVKSFVEEKGMDLCFEILMEVQYLLTPVPKSVILCLTLLKKIIIIEGVEKYPIPQAIQVLLQKKNLVILFQLLNSSDEPTISLTAQVLHLFFPIIIGENNAFNLSIQDMKEFPLPGLVYFILYRQELHSFSLLKSLMSNSRIKQICKKCLPNYAVKFLSRKPAEDFYHIFKTNNEVSTPEMRWDPKMRKHLLAHLEKQLLDYEGKTVRKDLVSQYREFDIPIFSKSLLTCDGYIVKNCLLMNDWPFEDPQRLFSKLIKKLVVYKKDRLDILKLMLHLQKKYDSLKIENFDQLLSLLNFTDTQNLISEILLKSFENIYNVTVFATTGIPSLSLRIREQKSEIQGIIFLTHIAKQIVLQPSDFLIQSLLTNIPWKELTPLDAIDENLLFALADLFREMTKNNQLAYGLFEHGIHLWLLFIFSIIKAPKVFDILKKMCETFQDYINNIIIPSVLQNAILSSSQPVDFEQPLDEVYSVWNLSLKLQMERQLKVFLQELYSIPPKIHVKTIKISYIYNEPVLDGIFLRVWAKTLQPEPNAEFFFKLLEALKKKLSIVDQQIYLKSIAKMLNMDPTKTHNLPITTINLLLDNLSNHSQRDLYLSILQSISTIPNLAKIVDENFFKYCARFLQNQYEGKVQFLTLKIVNELITEKPEYIPIAVRNGLVLIILWNLTNKSAITETIHLGTELLNNIQESERNYVCIVLDKLIENLQTEKKISPQTKEKLDQLLNHIPSNIGINKKPIQECLNEFSWSKPEFLSSNYENLARGLRKIKFLFPFHSVLGILLGDTLAQTLKEADEFIEKYRKQVPKILVRQLQIYADSGNIWDPTKLQEKIIQKVSSEINIEEEEMIEKLRLEKKMEQEKAFQLEKELSDKQEKTKQLMIFSDSIRKQKTKNEEIENLNFNKTPPWVDSKLWDRYISAHELIKNAGNYVKSSEYTEFRFSKNPFESGGERYVYFMEINKDPLRYVAKKFWPQKIPTTKFNELQKFYEDVLERHAVVHQLASEFNQLMKGAPFLIQVLPVRLFVYSHEEFFTCEELREGEFKSFNRNFVTDEKPEESVQFANAFSHFTYKHSGNQLLVLDIQGWITERESQKIMLITDPTILHVDQTQAKYCITDTGKKGMDEWISSHRCSHFCSF